MPATSITRRQLDKEENDERLQPPFGPHLDSEEIGSHDQLPMPGQELFPSSFTTPLRSRFNTVLLQNRGDGFVSDLVSEIGECTLDASIAPVTVFGRDTDNQFFELARP